MAQLYIATQGIAAEYRGRSLIIAPGDIGEEGNGVVANNRHAFQELVVRFPAPGSSLQEQKPAQVHPRSAVHMAAAMVAAGGAASPAPTSAKRGPGRPRKNPE